MTVGTPDICLKAKYPCNFMTPYKSGTTYVSLVKSTSLSVLTNDKQSVDFFFNSAHFIEVSEVKIYIVAVYEAYGVVEYCILLAVSKDLLIIQQTSQHWTDMLPHNGHGDINCC